MDDLLSLPVVNSVSDAKGIRQLYDKTEIHIRPQFKGRITLSAG